MKTKNNKQDKQLPVKVLIRKAASLNDKWFGTVRVDYGDIYIYDQKEDDNYTLCFDTKMVNSKSAAKKLAKEFCDLYDLRIKRYVYC